MEIIIKFFSIDYLITWKKKERGIKSLTYIYNRVVRPARCERVKSQIIYGSARTDYYKSSLKPPGLICKAPRVRARSIDNRS